MVSRPIEELTLDQLKKMILLIGDTRNNHVGDYAWGGIIKYLEGTGCETSPFEYWDSMENLIKWMEA
jgi:hypothetical protein